MSENLGYYSVIENKILVYFNLYHICLLSEYAGHPQFHLKSKICSFHYHKCICVVHELLSHKCCENEY